MDDPPKRCTRTSVPWKEEEDKRWNVTPDKRRLLQDWKPNALLFLLSSFSAATIMIGLPFTSHPH
jgi:hypothetical protein